MVAVTAACSNEPAVTEPLANPLSQAVKFWEDNAAVDWNTVARAHVAANNSNALVAIRGYAIVSLAQYQAAVAAEQAAGNGPPPSVHAAIAAASVVALTYLYPAAGDTLEDRLDRVLALPEWPGHAQADIAAGEAIGRAAAAAVVTRATSDRFFAPFTGTVPVCDGCWFSATAPAGAMVGQAKTYFLSSGNQFRPAPPPAYNSPAFLAALAEVRQISDTRTAELTAIAQFWNLPAGTYQPPGYWNEAATKLAVKYHLGERETAHLLALMNMVSHDIIVASHEAKYYYWLLRPTMADPGITLPIGLPNFPSYPSNHAAISAGMAQILGDKFPAERARLDALAEEAMISRVYGGIHYRFDGDAGLELGRRIAAYAAERDVNGKNPFILD
jgi:membrane-associated phospholipid phosphatase